MCDIKKSISVPTDCLGKLIGKGGQNIRNLESETNTKIQITKDKSGLDTEVILIGESDQITAVEQQIMKLTLSGGFKNQSNNSYSPRVPGGSRNQSENTYGPRVYGRSRPPPSDSYTQNYSDGYGNQTEDTYRPTVSTSNRGYRNQRDNTYTSTASGGYGSHTNNTYTPTVSGGYGNHSENNYTPTVSGGYGNPPSNFYTPKVEPVSNYEEPPAKDYGQFDMKKLNADYEQAQLKYWSAFPTIKKIFYDELPEVANMPAEVVAEYRQSLNDLVVERPLDDGTNRQIPNPISTFVQAFHNYPDILGEIEKVGFTHPTPIQCQSWPVVLSGEDMIGIAQTGTGKTLAFLLPALIHIDSQEVRPQDVGKPSALVLAPTRELALQIHKEVNKYNYKDIKSICIYGGADRKAQIAELKLGANIIIATPGRLDDLVLAGHIDPETITYVVLDEADRMLDMGFEPQIRKTLYKVRPDRQTIMTSATWPNGVRRLAISYMQNPVQIFVGSLDLAAVHTVQQVIQVMEEEEKFNTFLEFIKGTNEQQKIMVFAGKKSKASFLSSELACMGIFCSCMHGDLEQCDREQAIEDMINGTERILIATDIISRGIDIDDITHVVNFDFPRNIEDYVHRVGRTGRAGRSGMSITYFTWSDARHAEELMRILEEADQTIPPELVKMNLRYKKKKETLSARGGGQGNYNRRY